MGSSRLRRRAYRLVALAGRGAIVVVLVAVVIGVAPATACACSCAARPPAEVVRTASALVVGTPVAADVDGSATRYRVEVQHSYKQRMPETITVMTASSSASCGLELSLDEERLIVLGDDSGPLSAGAGEWGASLCDNTARVGAEAEALAGAAIEPYPVDEPDPASPAPAIVGAFVALAALVAVPGAVMWWRVRVRRAHPGPDD